MGPARRNAQGAGEPSRRGIRADQNLEEALEKHLESIRVIQHAATPGRARGRRKALRAFRRTHLRQKQTRRAQTRLLSRSKIEPGELLEAYRRPPQGFPEASLKYRRGSRGVRGVSGKLPGGSRWGPEPIWEPSWGLLGRVLGTIFGSRGRLFRSSFSTSLGNAFRSRFRPQFDPQITSQSDPRNLPRRGLKRRVENEDFCNPSYVFCLFSCPA